MNLSPRIGTTIKIIPGLSLWVSWGKRGPGISFHLDPGVVTKRLKKSKKEKAKENEEISTICSALSKLGFKKPEVDSTLEELHSRGEDKGKVEEVLKRALSIIRGKEEDSSPAQ
jgi:hypothetical protein